MKRIFALALAMVLSFITVSFIYDGAMDVQAAVSQHIFTIIANPGENSNTEVGISWTATYGKVDCFVEYKPKSESGWDNATVIKGEYNDTDYQYFLGNSFATSAKDVNFTEEHKFYSYNCDLINLTPATEYKYRVGDGEGNYSSTHYFKTSGADEFSFVWISDFHTYSPLGGRLGAASNAISYAVSQAKNGVDMIFSTGDTVAYGGSYYFWKQLFDSTNWAKRYLYVDVNGNHDNMNNTNTKNTFNYFRIMHNNPENCYLGTSDTPFEPGVVYYFMYGDILWFVFDNETMNAENRAQFQEWAGKVIEAKEGTYKYLFISEHYQWFTGETGKSSHYSNWNNFCDKYNVDVAFAGNNHIYTRSHKLYKGEVVAADSDVGTYYIQAPSSDCERGSAMNDALSYNQDIIASRYTGPKSGDATRTLGVSLLDVTPNGITMKLFGSDNASQSSPQFELKDTVVIKAKRTLASDSNDAALFGNWKDENGNYLTFHNTGDVVVNATLSDSTLNYTGKFETVNGVITVKLSLNASHLETVANYKIEGDTLTIDYGNGRTETYTKVESFEYEPPKKVVYGDIDLDGSISAKDASLVLRYNVQLVTTLSNMEGADVNGDGNINAADASLILQYNVQLINKFPAEDK